MAKCMKEQINSNNFENESFEAYDLEDFASEADLSTELPSKGSVAYERVLQTCKDYANAVDRQCKPQNFLREGFAEQSEKNRRSLHNKLCVMLFGTSWHDTDRIKKDQISNFAVLAGGRKEYFGTF